MRIDIEARSAAGCKKKKKCRYAKCSAKVVIVWQFSENGTWNKAKSRISITPKNKRCV